MKDNHVERYHFWQNGQKKCIVTIQLPEKYKHLIKELHVGIISKEDWEAED